uniref:Uncharacterized protein n=1 Tax=Ralstonia solanacearum TaxID=305 RepID=A0A0S4X3Q3_RALSL|nr:protein of unknown function [Ralstonia solanacearum]
MSRSAPLLLQPRSARGDGRDTTFKSLDLWYRVQPPKWAIRAKRGHSREALPYVAQEFGRGAQRWLSSLSVIAVGASLVDAQVPVLDERGLTHLTDYIETSHEVRAHTSVRVTT